MSERDRNQPSEPGPPLHKKAGMSWGFIITLVLIGIAAPYFILPHFLEASTRSKESRARSDMRSLAVAIDAYFQDTSSYPAWTTDTLLAVTGEPRDAIELCLAPTFRVKQNQEDELMTLTTPVAYIISIFGSPWPSDHRTPFRYYAVMGDATLRQASDDVRKLWIVWSTGRDMKFDITLPLLRQLAGADPNRLTAQELAPYTYDPTNGIESGGDVWRLSSDARWDGASMPIAQSTSDTLSTTRTSSVLVVQTPADAHADAR